jgi:hypothetical protein
MTAAAIEVTIPIKTVNESNGQHGHWIEKSRRRREQRKASFDLTRHTLKPAGKFIERVTVTMSRMSAGTLDDDNLRVALKSVRDGIADALGMADNDPRITWAYGQERCKRGEFGVRIRIEAADER